MPYIRPYSQIAGDLEEKVKEDKVEDEDEEEEHRLQTSRACAP